LGTDIVRRSSWVLLTGATGFLGQGLLSELLDRGYRVLVVVRAATPSKARERLRAALAPWERDAENAMESGRLAVLRGDLHRPWLGLDDGVRCRLRGALEAVVHAAASTTFRATTDGEPYRTNVSGTRQVWRLASECACREWHLISTAYVCGRRRWAEERLFAQPPAFHNDYERSKWQAETESARTAQRVGATLTVYRPSVVVGRSDNGIATRFVGIYYLLRATSLVAQAAAQRGDDRRHRIPLRIRGDADARPNLVFVDDVARDFADVFDDRTAHGGVYHLTHPDPPTNGQIKRVLERYYDIGGGRFVGRGATWPAEQRSDYEELFENMTGAIGEYILDSPDFDRRRMDRVASRAPTPWSDARLRRLIEYAESVRWRTGCPEPPGDDLLDGLPAYFEQHLLANAGRSSLARVTGLDISVRFVIEGTRDADWWCRFEHGRLVEVCPTGDRRADVTYRTRPAAFWRAVAGEVSGASLFLSGEARMEGDIERGLKFAMLLERFVREFPCRRESLLTDAARTA